MIQHLLLLFVLLGTGFVSFSQTAPELYDKASRDMQKKNYKSALKYIDEAIEIDAKNPDFFDLKGECLVMLGKFQEAYDTYSKAIRLFPKESRFYYWRGTLLLESMMPEKA